MSGTQPVLVYGLKVPPGDILIPGAQDMPAMYRVTMAAIDPTEEAEADAEKNGVKPARSTLKIIRMGGLEDQFSSEDEDEDEDEDSEIILDDEDEESSDEEEVNGGPSDPEKVKKARDAAFMKESSSEDESDDEGPVDIGAALKRIAKGKAVATDDDDGDDDDDDDSSEGEELEMEEFVVCTLDPEKQYQQPLDIVCNEHERVFFKVTGSHTVYLTGNYVIPMESGPDESYEADGLEDEYDLSPDEDELDQLEEGNDESDELDDLDDPRITELGESNDEMDEAPKLVEKGKGKNKRVAQEIESESENEAATLDDIIAKSIKPAEPLTNGEAKLSKKERKKLKKLNNGQAAAVEPVKAETKDTSSSPVKTDKKVQFADKLEQGPTNSKKEKVADKKTEKPKAAEQSNTKSGVKEVHGVTIDDRKLGEGHGAKKGDRLEMRYIGKLDQAHGGKVFDSNKKGKPFSFKLGAGEVIKGWDIGLVGMAIGGERRLTIPANLAYGSKAQQGIPANSILVFDVKLLSIK